MGTVLFVSSPPSRLWPLIVHAPDEEEELTVRKSTVLANSQRFPVTDGAAWFFRPCWASFSSWLRWWTRNQEACWVIGVKILSSSVQFSKKFRKTELVFEDRTKVFFAIGLSIKMPYLTTKFRKEDILVTLWEDFSRSLDIEAIRTTPPPALAVFTSLKLKQSQTPSSIGSQITWIKKLPPAKTFEYPTILEFLAMTIVCGLNFSFSYYFVVENSHSLHWLLCKVSVNVVNHIDNTPAE